MRSVLASITAPVSNSSKGGPGRAAPRASTSPGAVPILPGPGRTRAGEWALKPRDVEHAMWNPTDEPARIIEVLTPGGTERWFEELAALADEDEQGFADAC